MWDRPFDPAILSEHINVVINCPEEDLERECAAILTSFGITYPDGESILKGKHWHEYHEDFCYYVKDAHARRGPKPSPRYPDLDSEYEKFTFYGENQDDIPDESFEAILGGD